MYLVDSTYKQHVWTLTDEDKAHLCIEEVYSKIGFLVKNFHRDDRLHESGIDLLCTKKEKSIGIAVKKKPKQEDIVQLKKLSDSDYSQTKLYIYLDIPTRPFEEEMKFLKNVHYLDWNKLHSLLVGFGSIHYLLLYFANHKLFENLSTIFELLYEKRTTKYYKHVLNQEENEFMWNIKDDAVKLKSILEHLQARWRSILLTRLQYNKTEWISYINKIHEDLDNVNNIAGESLRTSFLSMSNNFPHLAARYWELASYRTIWKDFVANAIKIGKTSNKELREFIRYKWVMPTLDHNRRSSEYGPINGVYSVLWAILESTYHIADDIECGIDWLHHDII